MEQYWRSLLPPEARPAYDTLAGRIPSALRTKKFGRAAEIPVGELPQYLIDDVFTAVLNDMPSLFYLEPGVSSRVWTSGYGGPARVSMAVRSIYPPEEIARIEETLRRKTDQLRRTVGGEQAQQEAVLDYILKNVTYEVNNERNQNAASALYYGKAQCSGISRAVKYLFDQYGLWCILVTGEANGTGKWEPHAWNIVRYKGSYCHFDATFLLGRRGGSRNELVNVSDEVFAATHRWDRSLYPRCPRSFPSEPTPPRAAGSVRIGGYGTDDTPLIVSADGLRAILPQQPPKGTTAVKFRYDGDPRAAMPEFMKAVKAYAVEKRLACGFSIQCEGRTWTVTLRVNRS